MRIEVWSDFACPWCWLGKRHLERALERDGTTAEVVLRSFELDPGRGATVPVRSYLAVRYGSAQHIDAAHRHLDQAGATVGLRYDFPRAVMGNTFDAHRVHHLARARGLDGAVAERLFRAQHGEGADLADRGVLVRLAVEAGLDGGQVEHVLATDAYAADVRRDEAEARELGVSGVPFFVLDRRLALSGAHPVEVFGRAVQAAKDAAAAED